MLHIILIILHAASGVIGFVAGCMLVFSNKLFGKQKLFELYWWSLLGLFVFMTGAVVVGWQDHNSSERIIFSGLLILGVYMLYRALKAKEILKSRQNGWRKPFINHVGFTLISLFEGFIIVAAIDLGAPGFMVALIAILGVIIGSRTINSAKVKAS